MTTYYVDDSAGGAGTGASWTDAWTSFWSITGLIAGDIVLVASTHNQNSGAASQSLTLTGTTTSKISIISANTADDSPTVGATLTTSSGFYDFNLTFAEVYIYGVTFNPGDDTNMNGGSGGQVEFESCTIDTQGTASSGPLLLCNSNDQTYIFNNCTINTQFEVGSNRQTRALVHGGSLTTGSDPAIDITNEASFIEFIGVDLSGCTGDLIDPNTTTPGNYVHFSQCRLNASYNIFTVDPPAGFVAMLDNCSTAAVTTQTLGYELHTIQGSTDVSTAKYRTGGGADGEQANPYSIELTCNGNYGQTRANSIYFTFNVIVADTATTLTAYVAHNAVGAGTAGALTDKELWMDVISPHEGGTAYANGQFDTTYTKAIESATDLTTDSGSTWNGTGVGTKQKLSVTIAPTNPGLVEVWIYFGPKNASDKTVYVDSEIEVS